MQALLLKMVQFRKQIERNPENEKSTQAVAKWNQQLTQQEPIEQAHDAPSYPALVGKASEGDSFAPNPKQAFATAREGHLKKNPMKYRCYFSACGSRLTSRTEAAM